MKMCEFCRYDHDDEDNQHPDSEIGGMSEEGWVCDECWQQSSERYGDGVPEGLELVRFYYVKE